MDFEIFPGRLVCITGIDGAGKTTISKEVVDELNEDRDRAVYVYGKYLPRLLLPFLWLSRRIFLRNSDQFENYTEYTDQKEEATKEHPILSAIYVRIMLLDYSFQLFLRVCVPLLQGKTVICDRYVFDTVIVDIADDFDYTLEESFSLISQFLKWYPEPDITILLDVPEEVSMERKNDIPALDYLKSRRARYLKFANHFDVQVVDGTASIPNVVEEVTRIVTQ